MKKLVLSSLVLLLAACASNTSSEKASMPDDLSAKALGIWKEVGNIHDNNITVFYDTGSLNAQGNIVNLRERKIVVKTEQENYLNLPEFKTVISEWAFDCVKRTYRVKNAHFWDSRGKVQGQQQYDAANVPAMAVVASSPSERLLNIACNKK